MSGRIVFKGKTRGNRNIVIRYPAKNDLRKMWKYINALSKEKTFIAFQGENISLQREKKYLESKLKKISKNEAVQLLVFYNDRIIGNSDITLEENSFNKHEGTFGISIAKDYRGQGIGTLLIKLVINEATKHLPKLRIITLGVFSNNPLAKSIYEKFGFKEYGALPKGISHRGKYVDHIYMYKNVK